MAPYQKLPAKTTVQNLSVLDNVILKNIKVVTPVQGTALNIALTSKTSGVIVAPTGPITSAVTITFPTSKVDGQLIFISFSQNLSNLAFAGGTFANTASLAPSVSAGDNILLRYDSASDKWYKLLGGTAYVEPA